MSDCFKIPYSGKGVAGYTLRLVDVNQNRVVVAEPGSRYVALSYVWPKETISFKAREKHFQRTVSKTDILPIRDDHAAYFDVPVDQLPKPIQHALHVTRTIGERYLWVDALCIIQNDSIDIERTVYRMDEIYKGATLTIVMADRAGTVLQGGRPRARQ